MKRHPALRNLSVDHHHGLVQAHRLLKAAQSPAAAAAGAQVFLEFWKKELNTHFSEEEQVLLPFVALHAPAALELDAVTTMLRQHARIRGMVLEIGVENPGPEMLPGVLVRIGTLLDEHIRLEERVIFPAFQDALPLEALDELQLLLEEADRSCSAAPSRDLSEHPNV